MNTIEFEKKIVIDKPVETVFSFLEKHENHQQFVKANKESKQVTDGPFGIGTKVCNVAHFMKPSQRYCPELP